MLSPDLATDRQTDKRRHRSLHYSQKLSFASEQASLILHLLIHAPGCLSYYVLLKLLNQL